MPDRTFDLIVYGATGFTGRLVAEYLVARAPADLRWAIAGRSKTKLDEVVARLGTDVPVIVADSGDAASIQAMAEQTTVVCTTVGPYARHGEPLVQACAVAGTHYCDLTGEPQWVRRMIDAHQPAAQASGAQILHSCGFDSIPSDLGTWFVQQQMQQRHGVPASHVSARLKAARGTASGGTVASGLDMVQEAARDRDVRAVLADAYGLNPEGQREGPDSDTNLVPVNDEAFDSWSAPFVMAVINGKVVRRTNAVLDYPYGRDFTYDERMLTGKGPVGLAKAAGIAAGMAGGAAGGVLTAFVPGLRGLAERVLPSAGDGPSEKVQANGFWDMRFFAEHPRDPAKSLKAKVVGQGDPGYASTSKMLAETALALAAGEAVVAGGMWTPAAALGDALLDRLVAHADVEFTII